MGIAQPILRGLVKPSLCGTRKPVAHRLPSWLRRQCFDDEAVNMQRIECAQTRV